MCEFDRRVMAWLDGELDEDAARQMDQHVETCESCSARASEYGEISRAFAAYVESAAQADRPQPSRRFAIGAGAVLAGAAAATILWMLRPPPPSLPLPQPKVAAPPAMALTIHPPLPRASAQRAPRSANAAASVAVKQPPSEPTVEIAIPADAIFAPGAFPSGFAFAADLSIRGDGSAEALRVRPASYLK